MHSLGSLTLSPDMVFIVENKVNLFTLPQVRRAVALGGLGDAVILLKHYLFWLEGIPILYWGDLGVDGLDILSSLWFYFPKTESLMMDMAMLENHQCLAIHNEGGRTEKPDHLTIAEQTAYAKCRDCSLRLEQERIPQSEVLQQFSIFPKPTSYLAPI